LQESTFSHYQTVAAAGANTTTTITTAIFNLCLLCFQFMLLKTYSSFSGHQQKQAFNIII